MFIRLPDQSLLDTILRRRRLGRLARSEFPMSRQPIRVLAALAILSPWATSALARNEQPAGGAFMSSYTSDPYFDPRSRYSQEHSLGDIGGQPMLTEPNGERPPCALFDQACEQAFERNRRHAYP